MTFARTAAVAALALFLVLVPSRSEATTLRLGVGADYWFDEGAIFDVTVGVYGALAGPLSVGGRFGALVATSPSRVGVPLDFALRATFSRRVYVEGLVGPWILFGDDPLRAHAAFGFGLQGPALALGLEVGWLDPAAIAGLRLSWRF